MLPIYEEKATSLEVNLMHVLQRPHLSRAVGASIVAALLAIMITLLFATALGGLSTSGGAGSEGPK